MINKVYALVDCNSFYVSCEKVFNPALKNKPVVVLSNNDGCAISRSQEAKDVGIAMGAPIFKCESLVKRHDVKIFSANFNLYGDMSARVMSTLATFTPNLEIYSIDEAFLDVTRCQKLLGDPVKIGYLAQQKVYAACGLPCSVGVSGDKTTAKYAAESKKPNGRWE